MTVRSKVAAIAVGALAVVAAAGCTPDGEVPPEQASASSSTPPSHLRVAVYGPGPVLKAYRTIVSGFNDEHPRVTIELSTYKSAGAELRAVRSGAAQGLEPDVFMTGVESLPGLQRDELITSVVDLLAARQLDFGDGYPRRAIEQFSSDSTLQCMPTQYSPMVVYYNPDLVDLDRAQGEDHPITATHGWSMEQFVRAAQHVVAGGHAGVYIDPSVDQLAPFVVSAGGAVVDSLDAPTTTTLGSSDAAEGITAALTAVGLNKGVPAPTSRERAVKMFERGKLGMLLGYRDLTGVLRADRTDKQLNFDVLPMPVIGARSTTGRLAGMCMSSTTADPDGAADFLAYVVGTKAMSVLARTGYVMPTNLEVISSNAFWQPRRRPASASVFTGQVRRIDALPVTGIWPRVQSLADRHLAAIFSEARPKPDVEVIKQKLAVLDEDTAAVLTPQPETPSASTSASQSPSAQRSSGQ